MRRPETGTSKPPSWWLELISSERSLASEYIKSHSRKVADVMSRNVVTASPDTLLGDIAALLERNRIKRVPIVQGGKIVGIVSRANILQALASATKKLPSLASDSDAELRRKVMARLAAEKWRPTMLTVTVQDGTADLWGLIHSSEEKKAARLAAELTPGVRSVVEHRCSTRWLGLVIEPGHAALPHPALGQDFTPSLTARRATPSVSNPDDIRSISGLAQANTAWNMMNSRNSRIKRPATGWSRTASTRHWRRLKKPITPQS
jgi:CBS domain/BON domain